MSHSSSWAALVGLWGFDRRSATYRGSQDPAKPLGLAVADLDFRGGVLAADITLSGPAAAGRLLFGHDPETGAYYSAGVGGGAAAYVVDDFLPGRGWMQVASTGAARQPRRWTLLRLAVYLYGQLMWLEVEDVEVLRVQLPHPLPGRQTGATAWSSDEVTFADVRLLRQMPEAFVVMQFGDPYDELYRDVIVPTTAELGFEARRADDIFSPGIILQDIVTGLIRASVVIAEITP